MGLIFTNVYSLYGYKPYKRPMCGIDAHSSVLAVDGYRDLYDIYNLYYITRRLYINYVCMSTCLVRHLFCFKMLAEWYKAPNSMYKPFYHWGGHVHQHLTKFERKTFISRRMYPPGNEKLSTSIYLS